MKDIKQTFLEDESPTLNNLRLQIKSIASQTKLHVCCIHGLEFHTEEVSLVYLDDLDNISFLLDEDNDLEEEITHLYNEVSIFILKFEKNTTNQALKIFKTRTVIRGSFEQFQVCFLV